MQIDAATCLQITTDKKAAANDVAFYALITLLNLANVLVLASPLWARRLRRGRGQVYTTLFGCAATAAWTLGVSGPSDLLVGYYVWCLALLCILSAARPGSRTLVAMCAMAAIWTLPWFLYGSPIESALPPPPPATVVTTGTVTLGGKPVEGATVAFIPIAVKSGTRSCYATTDAAGRFRLWTPVARVQDGGFPGDYVVTVCNREAWPSQLSEVYAASDTSPLRCTVVAGEPNDFKLDLQ